MNTTEIVTAVLIHIVVPFAGLAWYVILCQRLRRQGASPGFLQQLFLIFFCWGGLLLLVLTALFWQWSGMATLGAGFLYLIAPFLLAAIAFSLRSVESPSVAQRIAFRACLSYYLALILLYASALLFSRR